MAKEEIWKDIKGFDNYRVSNYGRVQSCTKIIDYANCIIIYKDIVILSAIKDTKMLIRKMMNCDFFSILFPPPSDNNYVKV